MAISPGTYNISLQRRADYSITLQFKDKTPPVVQAEAVKYYRNMIEQQYGGRLA